MAERHITASIRATKYIITTLEMMGVVGLKRIIFQNNFLTDDTNEINVHEILSASLPFSMVILVCTYICSRMAFDSGAPSLSPCQRAFLELKSRAQVSVR